MPELDMTPHDYRVKLREGVYVSANYYSLVNEAGLGGIDAENSGDPQTLKTIADRVRTVVTVTGGDVSDAELLGCLQFILTEFERLGKSDGPRPSLPGPTDSFPNAQALAG